MPTPEQLARQNIDTLLAQCGWIVRSRAETNLGAGRGIAVREFPLKTGYADYLLLVDRHAIGAIEAKAEKYSVGLPAVPSAWHTPLSSRRIAVSERPCGQRRTLMVAGVPTVTMN